MTKKWIKALVLAAVGCGVVALAYAGVGGKDNHGWAPAAEKYSGPPTAADPGLASGCPYLNARGDKGGTESPGHDAPALDPVELSGDSVMGDMKEGTCPHHPEGEGGCCAEHGSGAGSEPACGMDHSGCGHHGDGDHKGGDHDQDKQGNGDHHQDGDQGSGHDHSGEGQDGNKQQPGDDEHHDDGSHQ